MELLVCRKSTIECSRDKRKPLGRDPDIAVGGHEKGEYGQEVYYKYTHYVCVHVFKCAPYFIYICTYTYETYINEYHMYNLCIESMVPNILS